VDEQEHSAGPEPAEGTSPGAAPAPGATSPVTAPVAGQQHRRGENVRRALTSRAAGWVVAAVLAGAVVALSIVEATAPSPVAVQVPFGAAGRVFIGPGGPGSVHMRVVGPPGPGWQVVGPPGGPGWEVVGPPASWVVPAGPPGQFRAGAVPVGGMMVSVGPGGKTVSLITPFGFPPGKFVGRFMSPFGQVVAGTVGSVSSSGFTITGGGGQTVTVTEQSSTVYRKAGSPATASAVTRGVRVAVLGSQSGSKITAIVVAVLPG
jgi:hypothetical protein